MQNFCYHKWYDAVELLKLTDHFLATSGQSTYAIGNPQKLTNVLSSCVVIHNILHSLIYNTCELSKHGLYFREFLANKCQLSFFLSAAVTTTHDKTKTCHTPQQRKEKP